MTDKTLEWDGAPVIETRSGFIWLRQPDGRYRCGAFPGEIRTPEGLASLNPQPVELHPATTPEPRTVTWRKGEDQTAIREAWKPGRRAQVATSAGGTTHTRDGVIEDNETFASFYAEGWIRHEPTTSITVWLPETPEVPKWAQDCSTIDRRLVTTDDGRVWQVALVGGGAAVRWRLWGERDEATTDELADMDARLIVDRDGKAVL
ncbi:hypothetical protein M3G03_10215 [Aestuariimicrobium sp. p3-SID1156]|uniref:hypothetical protein n=1 Tax=Aestuariimicrobium sp. p3-SID1156 TaxID=2916038 RepID=UPI00223AD62F|nr:hypothetical protein [Aestuariimicrobium sp. p3-SID1156]MCT1459905.1 hypothetical protein [Aestuariimicrobium sp. p3-SID1156]